LWSLHVDNAFQNYDVNRKVTVVQEAIGNAMAYYGRVCYYIPISITRSSFLKPNLS